MGYAIRITTRAAEEVSGADKPPGIVAAKASRAKVGLRSESGEGELRAQPKSGKMVPQGGGRALEGSSTSPYAARCCLRVVSLLPLSERGRSIIIPNGSARIEEGAEITILNFATDLFPPAELGLASQADVYLRACSPILWVRRIHTSFLHPLIISGWLLWARRPQPEDGHTS
ncbi:uncharacterized protein LACBIDRAFT_298339 [Laccaria bicolor S238N-H82]|uniref:Predicted protein n=1 Tax=Laccaria bicolor (strain S238N-H82 / ATCC MYA-4686) TaxID=486041 RepID=B0E3A9_LACBS|nr:uncharacterized protein LACBIDRAFT_298339 [Laccaria bicolor S238N-H82]EDQ98664.1 predicted protein [Laccaria bicolor S238N-H82]|eukprot:XP_001890677.1 predicted protein [Laccaria bicolor S238N-H82]